MLFVFTFTLDVCSDQKSCQESPCPGGSPARNSVPLGGCCEVDNQCVGKQIGFNKEDPIFIASYGCNANNQCECQVAAGGNGSGECCTADSGCVTGEGGCAPRCKSMYFYPSIASPFH